MAKALNGLAKWMAVLLSLIIFGSGLIWHASTMHTRVNQIREENRVDHPKIQENHDDILKMQGKLDNIESAVLRIEKKLD